MSSFWKLLQNEHKKIFRLKSTWIMLALIVIIVCGAGYLEYRYLNRQGEAIDQGTVWTFLGFMDNLSLLIALATISIAGSILPKEYAMGTIKFLMIRPASRSKILLSKYITVLSFMFLFYLVVLVFGFVVGGIIYGFGTLSQTTALLGNSPMNIVASVGKEYLYSMINIIMYSTIAFMIAVLVRNSSLANGITIPLFFVGGTLPLFISRYWWAKYILFTNLDLSKYDSALPPTNEMSLGFSLTILALYYILFLAISFFTFQKRDAV